MQAKRSRETVAHFDMFECLTCDTVISESKPRAPAGDKNTG
ncbi:MAG TPA: hypothetical protein VIJ17_11550 [Pseudolabrys sp.]